jgi:ubiquitin conjugation factor E4 B
MTDPLKAEIVLLEKVLKVQLALSSTQADAVPLPGSINEISSFRGNSFARNLTLLDSIVVERFGEPNTSILQYAAGCTRSVKDEVGKSWSVRTQDAKDVMDYLKKILVSYSALALSQPDMFPEQAPQFGIEGLDLSATRLISFMNSGSGDELLGELFRYWDEEDPHFKLELVERIYRRLIQEIKTKSLFDSPQDVTQSLNSLLALPGLAQIFMSLDWIPSMSGAALENASALGPFFTPSYFPMMNSMAKTPGLPPPHDPVRLKMKEIFDALKRRSEADRTFSKLNTDQRSYVEQLVSIFKHLLRADKDKTLAWVAAVVQGNTNRAKLSHRLQGARLTDVSSEGMLFNLLDLLLVLCKPFLNPEDPRAHKIDPTYPKLSPRLVLKYDPICPGAAGEDSTSSLMDIAAIDYGTITEFYYLCAYVFHFGWHSARNTYEDLNRILGQLQNMQQAGAKKEFEYFMSIKHCYDVMLTNDSRCLLLIQFCNLTMSLLMRWLGFQGGPLRKPIDVILGSLPDYLIEDITEFYKILTQLNSPALKAMAPADVDRLVTFFVMVLTSPEHFPNPYFRANLVESVGFAVESRSISDIVAVIGQNEPAKNHLMRALVQFYVDIEFSGGHGQFYEKFRYRHYAASIFSALWSVPIYQSRTKELEGEQYFARFINMLINDTTWCLDEGLLALIEIRKYQNKLLEGTTTEEDKKTHDQKEGYCKYVLRQANESIKLIEVLTKWNSSLFVTEEFGNRIASMLNYFLSSLCGPRCLELKVDNPESYAFKPQELLRDILGLYLALSREEQFFVCVVNDERSYNGDLMHKALRVCYKRPILSYGEVQQFEEFVKKVKLVAQDKLTLEDQLGEIPEEFICPISCELMKNPVRLPTSGQVVDRGTIVRHLMTDLHDPFSRADLTVEMLAEDTELKAKIQAWIASKTPN